jgi:integrase
VSGLRVRHSALCALGRTWTSGREETPGCTCPGGPLYYVVVHQGEQSLEADLGRKGQEAGGAPDRFNSELDDRDRRPQLSIGFAEWAERWLESLERKPSTVGSYRSTIAHARRAFADRHVRALGPEDIERFNGALRDRGCSPSTRAKHLRVLSACLQAAVFYRYAGSNPVRELPPAHKPRPERKEAAYFENDELPRLFAHLPDEPYRTLCLVSLKTGMRQGELLALRWCDVDLDQAVIRVRRSYTGGTVGTPKSHERRDVDLISDVVERLARLQAERGKAGGQSLVFPAADGAGFVTPSVVLRRHLYPAMSRAGIPRVGPTLEKRTFHSFRHTFAKRALENGAQITWLSRHLGHSSLKVTTDIYGHWERAERKLQAAKMEDAFPV